MRHLSEYLAMRAKAREAQRFVVGLGVDQHQIGLDVAIAVARPIAAQIMVAVFWIKRRVGRERGQDGQKIGIAGDRQRLVSGKSGAVRVDLGGRRLLNTKTKKK